MRAIVLLLGLSLAALGSPPSTASHNICHGKSFVGIGEPEAMIAVGGGSFCAGPLGIGVEENVYAGPWFGATLRVASCSGQVCSDVVPTTGVLLKPDPNGTLCANGSCYALVTCLADSTCP